MEATAIREAHMARLRNLIRWQRSQGTPVKIGAVTVIPEARSLIVRWPHGGYVWNRPVAIIVNRQGTTRRLRIVDVTRRLELALLSTPLVLAIAERYLQARKRSKHHAT
ncbi:MAG: hypothetical protein M3380_11095 [Chloroflexota bacterium]|nr:hypothetical protein [Chloroflexota bacterium]